MPLVPTRATPFEQPDFRGMYLNPIQIFCLQPGSIRTTLCCYIDISANNLVFRCNDELVISVVSKLNRSAAANFLHSNTNLLLLLKHSFFFCVCVCVCVCIY